MQWWPWCLKIVINLRADQWKFLSYHLRKKHPWKLWPLGKHDEGSILGMWQIGIRWTRCHGFFQHFFLILAKIEIFHTKWLEDFFQGIQDDPTPAIKRGAERKDCAIGEARLHGGLALRYGALQSGGVWWRNCHDADGNFRIKKVDVGFSTSSTHSDFMVISCCFLFFIFVYIYLCQSKLTDIFPFRLEA